MSEQAPAPIIIIKKKKKGGHGGHHGGAWKVAYADFVTAMMALFIVLWLMNTSSEVQEAISGYFRDPGGTGTQLGSGAAGLGDGLTVGKNDMGSLQEKLQGALNTMPQFEQLKDQVAMTVSGEGLRVELLETEHGMFFDSGSPKPSASGEEMLKMLAHELGGLPNTILIEGHTDARPFSNGGAYTNWELSVDRANAARRLMEANGLRPDQVVQVRGFADQELRNAAEPEDPSNRRVSVIVQYEKPPPVPEEATSPAAPSDPAPEEH